MKHKRTFASIGILAIPFSILLAQSQKVQDIFTPLPTGQIELIGGLDNDIKNSIEHWTLGVTPYRNLVDFFRWGAPQFALGEMWGKAVRSGCMFYRYTHDPRLKATMKSTVDDLLTTTKSNGSISTTPVELQPNGPGGDMWERKYVMLGLDEYYRQIEQDPRVLEAMKRQADCIIAQIGHAPLTEITSLGWSPNHIESSTLLEPFMRLYGWTGEQRYLDFATYIVESGGAEKYNVLQQAFDNVRPREMGGPYPKAYEMMSLFEGLVDYHRVTGSEFARKATLNLYQNIRKYEITIIGNAGGDHPYHPGVAGEAWDDTALEQTNPDITRMMETCVGVTWLKFCSHILRLTGDPTAVDEIEKYIYNGLLGAMMPSGEGFSYVNLLNGRKQTNLGWGWSFGGLSVTCCNLNGPMGLAYIPYVAVMNSAEGPIVNLYNSMKVNVQSPKGQDINLQMVTDYPLSGKVDMQLDVKSAETFTLKLRIPSWTQQPSIRVNGEKITGIQAGEYLSIRRNWTGHNQIDICYPMECKIINAPHGSNSAGNNMLALKYGPVVLSRDENTDKHYNDPVQIKSDAKGKVKIKRISPTLSTTRQEFLVPTKHGKIHMVDYASVNCWGGLHVCTWLPTE